jgi:membrane protein YdbS with pleckstrin-like domain
MAKESGDQQEIILRKTPFLFLKWLVAIEFFFALLPFLAVLVLNVRQSYESSPFSGTLSYSLVLAMGMTILQVLILTFSFVAWYFPSYSINSRRVVLRRSNLFEDKQVAEIQSITGIEVRQGWLAQRLDYGTLLLRTRDTSDQARIKSIPNPAAYADVILTLVEAESPLPPVTAGTSVPEMIAGGENQHVEFKASLMWDYHQQRVNKALYEPVMKNVVGFLNSTGGSLLIGVDDDGHVLGLEADYQSIPKPGSDGFENVFNMAFNKMIGVEFRRFVNLSFAEIEGREICAVSVSPSTQPAYLQAKGRETFYIRAGNASQPLTVSQATRYVQEHFGS